MKYVILREQDIWSLMEDLGRDLVYISTTSFLKGFMRNLINMYLLVDLVHGIIMGTFKHV